MPLSQASANERIVLSFIGTGGRGRHLMRVAMANSDVQIAVVCDVMEQRWAQAVHLTRGKATPYKDLRLLLECNDPDAMCVTTPAHWHCIMTIAAATRPATGFGAITRAGTCWRGRYTTSTPCIGCWGLPHRA
jgi:hypothetical protein